MVPGVEAIGIVSSIIIMMPILVKINKNGKREMTQTEGHHTHLHDIMWRDVLSTFNTQK